MTPRSGVKVAPVIERIGRRNWLFWYVSQEDYERSRRRCRWRGVLIVAARRRRKLRYKKVEIRFAEELPPGAYWAIYWWQPFGMGEWMTFDGKARVTPGAIVGPRRQIEDVVVLPEKGRVRRARPHERRTVGNLAIVV